MGRLAHLTSPESVPADGCSRDLFGRVVCVDLQALRCFVVFATAVEEEVWT